MFTINNDEYYPSISSNYNNIQFKEYIPRYKILNIYPKIIKSIEENLVTFISSKTGSGKSTQVPKYLYQYLKENKKKNKFKIICTEPRSIACESISNYVELQNPDINIDTNCTNYLNRDDPYLYFLKESELLFLLKVDPYLKDCDILIIDEVHERTMKLDLLLYYIKNITLCKENMDRGFKLVFMSATFNTNEIHTYLSSAVNNEFNFTFGFIEQRDVNNKQIIEDNYDVVYRNPNYNSLYSINKKFNEFNIRKILREIVRIVGIEAYSGDYKNKTILIFVPDYKTIYTLYNMLNKEYRFDIKLHQFCSALAPWQQKELINKLRKNYYNNNIVCNVIIATTLAETCLTFPNCDVVIDTGLKKICKYNYECNLYEETIGYISQDSCIQRSGRCGRGKNRGISYRVFSEETFNMMDKYRKPDIEINNIELIILKLFENEIISKYVKNQMKEKGYLDFLSKVDKKQFDAIYQKLITYNALEKIKDSENEKITRFGTWAMKANMDIELGYYFDKFIEKYPEDINRESVFQLLNIISTSDNYNCELFYTDIDPDRFRFNLIDNRKSNQNEENDENEENNNKQKKSKTLVNFSKLISENIISNALKKNNDDLKEKNKENNECDELHEENQKQENKNMSQIEYIEYIYPYYYLFSKLEEIFSPKNIFHRNKIFQLGDWIISLYFINQYKLIKCLYHNYYSEKDIENCQGCKTGKYFYCQVYSLNEKFFTKQRTKISHIKSILKLQYINDKDFTVCEKEENIIAKWNIIYMNLIASKGTIYISREQIIRYINEFSLLNFDEILEKLYQEYKKLYIDIVSKYLEITKNENEMVIQKKIFEKTDGEKYKFELFFNKIDKVNLMRSYFFEFIPKNIDKFFCLIKFRKILNSYKNDKKSQKLSKLYYKSINPIFEEMLNKSDKLKNHFEILKNDILDKKDIVVFGNVGKHFYNDFIAPKLSDKNIEIYQNTVIYIYSILDKDFNKEERIADLIKTEKENYCNMINFIQCLKGGCLTIQLTQGLAVKNIFDTYQNRNSNKNKLLYYIKFNDDYDDQKDINYYINKIKENKELKYEELISFGDNLIIIFNDSLQFSLFSKKQNLNLKFIPYKQSIQKIKKSNDENEKVNDNNMKIFKVKFERIFSISKIHKLMQKYMKRINTKYNYRLNYYIDEKGDSDSFLVYYYIKSDTPANLNKNDIIGKECEEGLNNKIFSINWMTLTSDYEYIHKFLAYCQENNLNVIRKININKDSEEIKNNDYSREYELINYSIENMKLIQNYIGYTTIVLNSFAFLELKTRSKDTFLEPNQNIFSFASNNLCKINIIFNENKFIIYGAPRCRRKLYDKISEYFLRLQKEKIIYSLKGKENVLLIKNLKKKVNDKQITILISKGDNWETKIEFRKKYYDIISDILFTEKNPKIKNKKSNNKYRCEICLEKFDNQYNNNYFKLKLCGHKFCVECLKMYICESVNLNAANTIPIKCPKCYTIITNNDIFEIIVPNTQEYDFVINKLITLFMLKNNSEMNYNSDIKYFYCPNKSYNCNYIYSSQMKDIGETTMTCPNCSCRICLLCNNILDPNIPHDSNCQEKLYSKIDEKDRKWLLTNSKDCPMCHTIYEKDHGCNHMTCTRCNPITHFCYLCGNILNDENPLKHFSNKESKCYNKLWDDPKKNIDIEDSIDKNIDEEEGDEYKEDSKENENNIENTINITQNQNRINQQQYGNNYNNNYSERMELTRIMFDRVNNNRLYDWPTPNKRNNNYKKKYN